MNIKNVNFKTQNVEINGRDIPFLLPEKPNNCWTTSINCLLGPMLREEVLRKRPKFGRFYIALSYIVEFFGRIMKIDDAAYPNHFGFSTCIYEKDEIINIIANKEKLGRIFKDRAIIICGINEYNFDIASLGKYKHLPTRVVFYYDNPAEQTKKSRDFRRDCKKLEISGLGYKRFSKTISDEYMAKIIDAYNQLYHQKYSKYNPDFSAEYLHHMMANHGLEFEVLEGGGDNFGFATLFENQTVITSPMMGYNINNKETPMYRFLMSLSVTEAIQKQKALNNSGGAAHFKLNRNSAPCVEYMIIIDDHLPLIRRIAYRIFSVLLGGASDTLLKAAIE